jgi:hypothetical protein
LLSDVLCLFSYLAASTGIEAILCGRDSSAPVSCTKRCAPVLLFSLVLSGAQICWSFPKAAS